MHKVERNEPPEGLEQKNIEFNKNSHTSEEITNAWKSFTSSALKKRTVEHLEKMFKYCCAYCEGDYTGTSYPQIDHFKPKSLYPTLMFDYSNMNLACERCNNEKYNKYDEKLINPTIDNPEEHLKYQGNKLYFLDERGKITINILDLNSNDRIREKQKCCETINDRMKLIRDELKKIKEGKEPITQFAKIVIEQTIQEVEEKFEDGFKYSTMYKHNYKQNLEDLKQIFEELNS